MAHGERGQRRWRSKRRRLEREDATMANPKMTTRTLKISATPEVWLKLERFFALMHFNAGHSAVFGLNFDGDGADAFKVDPPPSEELRRPAQRIGDAGPTLEMATAHSYISRHIKPSPFFVMRTPDELLRASEIGECPDFEVVRRYDR
jgi:hypothetical protein